MQPTGAMRSHSTKNQLKEKSPEANFIRSNTWWALLLFKVQKIQFQCHLPSVSFSHAATVPLARSSPPLPLVRSCTRVRGAFLASVARWLALAGVFCSVGTSRGGRQEAHHGRTPFRAAHRSLALRVASCTPAHARSTATVAGKHGTRSPPPTGPRHPRSVELALNTQTPASLTPKRTH